MTAEYALKKALGTDSQIQVHSAGLVEAPHEIVQFVKDYRLSTAYQNPGKHRI